MKRLVKTKKRASATTAAVLIAIYTAFNLLNKYLNAAYVTQNGFSLVSYHPLTFWISLVGSVIWVIASMLRGLRVWWYIPGILGIAYAVYMLFGGMLFGWFF